MELTSISNEVTRLIIEMKINFYTLFLLRLNKMYISILDMNLTLKISVVFV